jgi:uncharacterized circularly permuted ATP-grasp superfamily protein
MRTTRGPKRVDVIYRRIDDDFLDPLVFRADSRSVCPACSTPIWRARDAGQCDRHRHRRRQGDLPYVPEMIEFYLGEKPILANVPTYRCREPDDLQYVLDHLARAGGQGGARLRRLRHAGRPAATRQEIEDFRAQAQAPSRTITSPSRRWRCRPARPSSRPASRRATSTCGRSCCRAR